MAAPISWAPGIIGLFLLENPHAHKIPRFGGGFWFFGRGWGGSANSVFVGAGIFLNYNCAIKPRRPIPLNQGREPPPLSLGGEAQEHFRKSALDSPQGGGPGPPPLCN